jgi:hypothetical protein
MSESTRKDVEHGSSNAKSLIAELDRRLAEDDANPNDTVSWETIQAEAQTRYGSDKQIIPNSDWRQHRNTSLIASLSLPPTPPPKT